MRRDEQVPQTNSRQNLIETLNQVARANRDPVCVQVSSTKHSAERLSGEFSCASRKGPQEGCTDGLALKEKDSSDCYGIERKCRRRECRRQASEGNRRAHDSRAERNNSERGAR